MEILFYQSFIVVTLILVRILAAGHLLAAAWIWTAFTIVNLFFPPLILLQLIVVWATYRLIRPPMVRAVARAEDQAKGPVGDADGNTGEGCARERDEGQDAPNGDSGLLAGPAQAMTNFGAGMGDIHDNARRFADVSHAISATATAFACERDSIETALESARFNVDLNRKLAADKQLKKEFDRIRSKIGSERPSGPREYAPERAIGTIPPAAPSKPPRHPDPATSDAINRKLDDLVAGHAAFLARTRKTVATDADMAREFAKIMASFGRSAIAEQIADVAGVGTKVPPPARIRPRRIVGGHAPHPVSRLRPSGESRDLPGEAEKPAVADCRPILFDDPETTRRSRIRAEARRRRIPHLVHFTQVANLTSIMTHGLVPVARARKLGLQAEINDADRWDGHLDASSLSIGFPNYRMFWKYRQLTAPRAWVVLLLEPSLLWTADCAFCPHNAADRRIRLQPAIRLRSAESFSAMFGASDAAQDASRERRKHLYLPTDDQAEVLAFNVIPPTHITGAVFGSRGVLAEYSAWLSQLETHVHAAGSGLFGTRDRWGADPDQGGGPVAARGNSLTA